MELNGKCVVMDGSDLMLFLGLVIWGELGMNGQYVFYQLIYQGMLIIFCEFMIVVCGYEFDLVYYYWLLIVNCFVQFEVLLCGCLLFEVCVLMVEKGLIDFELDCQVCYCVFFGNCFLMMLVMLEFMFFMLGQIVVFYEYCVFVEGVIFGINSFD